MSDDAIIAAGWAPAHCPELVGDFWRHPFHGGGGVFVYSTEKVLSGLDFRASEVVPHDAPWVLGDHVRVVDGSRVHGSIGVVAERLDDGLILVILDDTGKCWPVVEGEIAAAA